MYSAVCNVPLTAPRDPAKQPTYLTRSFCERPNASLFPHFAPHKANVASRPLSHYAALTGEIRCHSENVTQMEFGRELMETRRLGLLGTMRQRKRKLGKPFWPRCCYAYMYEYHFISPSNSRPILCSVEHLFTLGVAGRSRVDPGLEFDRARWNPIHRSGIATYFATARLKSTRIQYQHDVVILFHSLSRFPSKNSRHVTTRNFQKSGEQSVLGGASTAMAFVLLF
ncbi:hypothetical protein J3E69DRAFT_264655 [Trichoderma sp. SZMC 28015]